jgi:hypothetical protein
MLRTNNIFISGEMSGILPQLGKQVMDEYSLILPIFTVLILWKKTHVDIGAEKKNENQDSELGLLLSLSDKTMRVVLYEVTIFH